jgi:hypothetical protein
VPKTIPPVAVNASPPKARVIPKPEEPIHYDVIGFYSLFHGMTEIQRDKLLELYRGRWLRVSGATIADIADMGDTFMVTLTVPWGQYLQPFTCTSDKETDKQVGLLAKGSVVELTGQISGVVDLNHCKFDSIKPPSASPQ